MTAKDKLEDGATEKISPSLPTGPVDFLDLGPYPDAVEYFAQADSMLKDGVAAIQIEISAFLAASVYFVATATYIYVEGRFYTPIFFLLVALALLPANGQWAKL